MLAPRRSASTPRSSRGTGGPWAPSGSGHGSQSISGVAAYNAEQLDHQQGPLSWWQYIGTASFWENTLENWQSEFLAVGSMAILAVYLRQRGSPESKPVGTPHGATGVEG